MSIIPYTLSRSAKRMIFLIADTIIVPMALYAAFSLRFGTLTPLSWTAGSWILFPIMTVLGAGIIYAFRLPWIKLNAFETRGMFQIGLTALTLSLAAIVVSYLCALSAPRSVPMLFGANCKIVPS